MAETILLTSYCLPLHCTEATRSPSSTRRGQRSLRVHAPRSLVLSRVQCALLMSVAFAVYCTRCLRVNNEVDCAHVDGHHFVPQGGAADTAAAGAGQKQRVQRSNALSLSRRQRTYSHVQPSLARLLAQHRSVIACPPVHSPHGYCLARTLHLRSTTQCFLCLHASHSVSLLLCCATAATVGGAGILSHAPLPAQVVASAEGFSGGHFRPTPRAAFVSAFHGLERGHVVQFKGLELGQAPKHLMEKQRLLLTPQILNILQEVDEYFERVHAILFGPEEPLSPSSPAVGPASSCPPIPAGSSAASMDGVNALTGMMASTSIEQDAGTAPCASSIDAVMAATPNPWAGLLPAAAIFSMDLVCRAGNRGGGLPMVLAGPMGVGKSFTAWAVAASSYAQGRRVLYIGDANVWMDVDAAQQVRFLINSFVSLNRDILSLEERSRLERPTASWSDLKHILYDAAHPTVVVIDEHAPVVVKYEAAEKDGSLMLKHNWMLSFVKLHIWEGAHNTVVIFCGSSHASFELNHLKNGMQQYLRFMVPLEKDHELPEAKTLMLLEGVPSALLDDAMALDQLMTVTNGVPREISHFARFLRFTSIRLPNQTSVSAAVSASSSMVHSSGPWPHAATAATAGASSMHIAAATSSASESSSGVSRPDTRSHRAKKPSNVTHAQSPAMSSSLQPLSSSSKSGASHVVSIHELLDKFVEWRRKQIEYEASKYFDRLTPSQCSFYMNSLAALFSRSSAPNGPGDVSGFIDLGLCYRTWTPDGEVVRPLCLAATRALLALYHEKAPQHSQLAMRIHSMRGVKGDDFEDLVWHLLTRDGVLDERSVPCCYLNGESAGDLLLNWDDFYVLPHGQSPPLSFQDRSMLYRLPPGAPRWDFAAPNMLLQVSRSNFGVHNKESADISLSFVVDQPDGSCEISRMLNSLHKGTHVAEHSPVDHHFIFRRDGSVIPFHLVYVTLERPNHPGLFKRFPDLRIISALDVWSVASAGQTVSSGFTARG